MADIRLGSHDRGMLDRADTLKAQRTPLKTGLSAADAEAYARQRGGSEMLLKMPNGTYNVYAVSTSEAGKAITGSDFEDGTADVTLTPQDVAKLGGTKAYLRTDDGTLRTLEIAGIQLDNLDHSLIRADLNVNIQDKDGIESKSARDITGTLSGKVVVDRAMLEWALAQAEKETGLSFTLTDNPRDQSYKINASYGVGLGSITLKPSGTGLKVEVGGLVGGLADAGDWLGKKLGYDPQQAVDKLIRQHLGANLGLKVESQSLTEYSLAPDLKNNPLMREIPLSAQTSFKVEEIQLNPAQGNGFRIDSQGNLELNFNRAQVIGSTDSKAKAAVADKEGADALNLKVQAQLGNDFGSQVSGEAGLSVNVTAAEQAGLKARIKEFTGQEIGAGGQFEVSGVRFSAQANAQGQITHTDQQMGQFKFERLALDAQGVKMDLSAQNGVLQGELKDGKYRLDAQDITLKGNVNTPQGQLNISQLQLSGELAVDPKQPQKLDFAIPTGENIRFSGQFTPPGQPAIKVQNLNIGPAQFKLDAAQGQLNVAAQGKTPPRISLGALNLPDASFRNLQVTGPMQADLNKGTLALQARSLSLSGQVGPLELTRLSGSGNLNWDPAKGLQITQAQISAQGKLGELEVKQLKGAGNISVSPNGQVRFSSTKDLTLETGMGLSVKGNLALDYTPGLVQVETTSKSPVKIDYTDKSQGIDLQGVAYSGRMAFHEQTGELRLSSHPNQPLELKSGSISGVSLKDVSLSNGQISVQTQGGKFVAEPLPGQSLSLNGKIQGIQISGLVSQGPVRFDPAKQSIAWDQPASASLPDQGIDQLSTEGPVEISQDPQGRLHFRSSGGTISLKMGQLDLSRFKVEGEAILDPRTGQLSFSGLEGGQQGLKLQGSLNGYPINAESSGQLRILHTAKGVELTGEKVKLNGLVDGFTLHSPEGASGKVLITPQGDIDLKELNFDVSVDDLQLQNRNGLLKTTPQGFEINLSGDINAKQEQLLKFLQKFSGRQDIGAQAQAGIKQAMDQLQNHFGTFSQADIHYENMVIRFDKNFDFQGFEVLKDTRLDNAEVLLSLGRKPEKVNIGELHWRAEAEADNQGFRVKDGDIAFSLNQNMRDFIDRTVTQQLKDAGLKDVELDVGPSGQIEIKNATYEVRAKGRSGNNGTEIDIPLLSRLFKKPKKVMNISAKLDITPRIENNQLLIELDNLKLKGLLAQIINMAIDGEDKLADQVATQLRAEDIQFERKDGESLFKLDLNDLLKKQMDPNINLTSAEMSPDGKVKIGYTYGQKP